MELNSYFRGLLSNIEPSPEAVNIAKKSHEKLREKLRTEEQISQANPDTYLSGSYARDTAINDIKDVDIILLIDMDHTTTPPNVVIAWLQASLIELGYEVQAQGRSVQVTTDKDFQLDVVPATPLSYRDGPVWIPDRDAKEWVITHPKGQITFGVEKNKLTDQCYKPLVKIMKYWRDNLKSEDAKAKSYLLESLVAESIVSPPASYARGVVNVLFNIHQKYSSYLNLGVVPKISDPGYPSVNVAKRWKFNEFTFFITEVLASYKIAKQALDAQEEANSLVLWRKLFGSKFERKD